MLNHIPILLFQAFFIFLAYLLGSVSFAIVTSKWFDLDHPRSYGSGNPGATNVLRSGHKWAALLTLLGDALKGWLAIWLAFTFGPLVGLGTSTNFLALVGLAAFIGHLFPIFHDFSGGKGVATALGVLLCLDLLLGLAVLSTWLIVAYLSRYSSLAALVTSALAPFYDWLLFGSKKQALIIMLMSALLIWRHRSNLQNLLHGEEKRIGF